MKRNEEKKNRIYDLIDKFFISFGSFFRKFTQFWSLLCLLFSTKTIFNPYLNFKSIKVIFAHSIWILTQICHRSISNLIRLCFCFLSSALSITTISSSQIQYLFIHISHLYAIMCLLSPGSNNDVFHLIAALFRLPSIFHHQTNYFYFPHFNASCTL